MHRPHYSLVMDIFEADRNIEKYVDYLFFRSTDTVNGFGLNYYVLLCISITKKTDYSYMYYRRGGEYSIPIYKMCIHIEYRYIVAEYKMYLYELRYR